MDKSERSIDSTRYVEMEMRIMMYIAILGVMVVLVIIGILVMSYKGMI